jgi:hypothetical protein
MIRVVAALVVLAACHSDDRLSYTWDDRRILCSEAVDDLSQTLDWSRVEAQLELAQQRGWVALVHAHKPGETISLDTIDKLLAKIDELGLAYIRFDELRPDGPRKAGIAWAFDDDDVAGWMSIKDKLDAHHARLTFFVTRWYQLTQDELADLAELNADGHDLEPHSWDHVQATAYVHAHSLDDYLNDEVLPSIQIMKDAGYTTTSFAFPFGSTTDPINKAVLRYVDRVRTTPGPCPY